MPVYPSSRASRVRLADHDPDSHGVYRVDWSEWCSSVGYDVATSSWVFHDDLVKDSETILLNPKNITAIVVSSGVAGKRYHFTNTITAGPLTESYSFYVICANK